MSNHPNSISGLTNEEAQEFHITGYREPLVSQLLLWWPTSWSGHGGPGSSEVDFFHRTELNHDFSHFSSLLQT